MASVGHFFLDIPPRTFPLEQFPADIFPAVYISSGLTLTLSLTLNV